MTQRECEERSLGPEGHSQDLLQRVSGTLCNTVESSCDLRAGEVPFRGANSPDDLGKAAFRGSRTGRGILDLKQDRLDLLGTISRHRSS